MRQTPLSASTLAHLKEQSSPTTTTMIIYGIGKFDNLLDDVKNENFSGGLGNDLNGARQLGLALSIIEDLGVEEGARSEATGFILPRFARSREHCAR